MASLGVLYVSEPYNLWWTGVVAFLMGNICMFLDIYIHKRLIITAACLVSLEGAIARMGVLSGVHLPMTEIIHARTITHFAKRSGGRYATTYGLTLSIVLGSITYYTLVLWIQACQNGDEDILQFAFFLGLATLFYISVYLLYRTILNAHQYDEYLYDYDSAKLRVGMYKVILVNLRCNNWRHALSNLMIRFYYHSDKRLRDDILVKFWKLGTINAISVEDTRKKIEDAMESFFKSSNPCREENDNKSIIFLKELATRPKSVLNDLDREPNRFRVFAWMTTILVLFFISLFVAILGTILC